MLILFGVIASWNPLSATATAIGNLFGNPTWNDQARAADHAIILAMAWPAALTEIFLPFAVRQ